MLDFEFDEPAGILYCRFRDRMDAVNATQAGTILKDKLAALGLPAAGDDPAGTASAAPSQVSQIVFDLAQVDYVSSGFLRVCLQTAKQMHEASLRVVNTNPQIMKVFKVAGLDELLKVS